MTFKYTKHLLDRFFYDSNVSPGLYAISSHGLTIADYRYSKNISQSKLNIISEKYVTEENIVLGVLSGIYEINRCTEYIYSIVPSNVYPGFYIKKTLRDNITDTERDKLIEQHNYFENIDFSEEELNKAFSEHVSNNVMNLLSTFVITPKKNG